MYTLGTPLKVHLEITPKQNASIWLQNFVLVEVNVFIQLTVKSEEYEFSTFAKMSVSSILTSQNSVPLPVWFFFKGCIGKLSPALKEFKLSSLRKK